MITAFSARKITEKALAEQREKMIAQFNEIVEKASAAIETAAAKGYSQAMYILNDKERFLDELAPYMLEQLNSAGYTVSYHSDTFYISW